MSRALAPAPPARPASARQEKHATPPSPAPPATVDRAPAAAPARAPAAAQPPPPADAPAYFQRRLGTGASLPRRSELESLVGADLGHLDVALGVPAPGGRPDALAATRGSRLEFADTRPSRRLLAHETIHALQARRGASGAVDGRAQLEAEAHGLAARAQLGQPIRPLGRAPQTWLYDAPPPDATALRAALHPEGDNGVSTTRVLAILRANAAPADMAQLRASYGPDFFRDLDRCFGDTSWGEARGYLGNQLTLAENLQTRTGILVRDQAGILDTLRRWPDDDVLRMIEEANGTPAAAAPAPLSTPASPPAPRPASATWADVQRALNDALAAEDAFRATQLLLDKAERARATRPAPPPGTAAARPDAVSAQRVAVAYSRIAAAESADRPGDAFLAIADLNGPQRAALAPRLAGGSWPNMGADMAQLRAIAADSDDARALERAMREAGNRTSDVSPAMLENAATRASELINRARERLAALPPASSEERTRREAELAALQARFHERTLVQAMYFASHETGAATLEALGVPPERSAEFLINQVSTFDELITFIRRVPVRARLELTHSPWYQAKLTQILGINPSPAREALLLAALYEGHPDLAGSAFLISQQALLDANDIESAWRAGNQSRVWIALSRMAEPRRAALAQLVEHPPAPPADAHPRPPTPPLVELLRSLERGTMRERLDASRLRRGLAGEAEALMRGDAVELVVRGGRITQRIEDPRAFIELVMRTPAAQAELRRGMVIRRQLQANPNQSVSETERALAERYDAAVVAAEQIGERDHDLRLAFETVAFGEPDLSGATGQDPAVEADFMHYRLEERLAAIRTTGSRATTDTLSWAGPNVDENAARFRVYFDQVRLRGIGRAELAQLADLYYRTMAALDAFAPANRAFASTAAQLVAAVAATVVVSAASGGSMGPAAVVALAAFAGGATAGLTGAVIRGRSTDAEILTDVSTGAVEGAVSVVGSALAARAVHGATAGHAAGEAARLAGGTAVRRATGGAGAAIAESIIDGAIGGAAGELFQTAVDEATWDRGVAAAIAALMAALTRGAAFGAVGGLVGGALFQGASAAWQRITRLHGQDAVREVIGAFDSIALGHAHTMEGWSEAQLEGLFHARRLALAGEDESAAALLRQFDVVPEGRAGDLIAAFRARRELVVRTAAEMGVPVDDPGIAQRLGLDNVMVGGGLAPGTAEVRYAMGLDGVQRLELWVGPGTRLGDVSIHQETVQALRRWGDETGNLRGMLERVRAWARGGTLSNEEEVILELQKHARMIEAREHAMSGLAPGSDTANRLRQEIANLQTAADAIQARLTGWGVPEGVIAGEGGRGGRVEPEVSFRGSTRVSSEPPFDYRVRRFNDISELPRNLDGTIAPLPEGVVYTFPDGTRVWRENGFTRHDTVVRRGVGRRETELEFLSAGEHGRPEVAGMERAHTLGQGTGFESPFGILMAPAEVNQIIQNNGIEELLRGFRDAARGGERFHLSTLTQAHWGTSRLAEVRYRVSVSRGGGSPEFLFEYRITVGRNAPFAVEHGLANITESPDLSNYFDLVDVPARLRTRFAMRAGGGTAPIVHAENWASVEPLIDTPVATAVLPPGYTRVRSSDGGWIIRRRDPNDLRFQRLTVRPGPGGEPVIAVWRPFE